MSRGQLRDDGTGLKGVCSWGFPEAETLTHFRGCYISQKHTFIGEMLLSAGDRFCLYVSVRACGKAMLSY